MTVVDVVPSYNPSPNQNYNYSYNYNYMYNYNIQYPVRPDRLYERPSAQNAQGLFPPAACVFVGNLTKKLPAHVLAHDLEEKFSALGPCHVKVKLDKSNSLPGAFVQFEQVESAELALTWNECTMLHGRPLRIERSKGKRTVLLSHRSGAPVSFEDLNFVLQSEGPYEAYCWEPQYLTGWYWTMAVKITFVYIDDCKDAVKRYQNDYVFNLTLLPIEGSPFLPPHPPLPQVPCVEDREANIKPRQKDVLDAMRGQGDNTHKPLEPEFQPSTGRTVEEYVREKAEEFKLEFEVDFSEEQIMEVVKDLEKDRRRDANMDDWFEDEATEDEPTKDEPTKDELTKDEPTKDEPTEDEPTEDEPPKDKQN